MISKLCGALTLMVGFYGIGFVMKHKRRQEVLMLQQMQYMLDNLISDLQYQQYPLYRLMKKAQSFLQTVCTASRHRNCPSASSLPKACPKAKRFFLTLAGIPGHDDTAADIQQAAFGAI